MTDAKRRRFATSQDWHAFVAEIASQQPPPVVDLYGLRRATYVEIERLRGRSLFVYATKFPDAPPYAPITIEQGDVDGFTDLISRSPTDAVAIDVLLHSPGGSPEATERIVDLLRSRFKDVAFLIPHSAFSAATMLALSGDEIILHPSASLGPIDPQINGIPARAIRKGFDRVRERLKVDGPEALPAYLPLIEKHSLEILEICDDALELSKELASSWLFEYMHRGDESKRKSIEEIVEYFSDYGQHKTHSRPLTYTKLSRFDLKIKLAEHELAVLMREAYLLLSGFFSVSPFVKVFEDARGLTWGKQFQIVNLPSPPGTMPQPLV
ncbi:MAG TPA: hypothetical protein VNM92_09885 [Thermoanaerobaculia bacterium]|nr:hypothetical protein [Thermoanaerobaculia bacterium]